MLSLQRIDKKFDSLQLFNNFNISFEENKISCIFGPSGIGKTTIVNMVSGLVQPDNGRILGTENAKFSYIFQEPRLLEWYSVYENIDFVLKDIMDELSRKNLIDKYLKIVELADYKDYMPKKLSGGMAQRVSIARAFAFPSDILIMDEPFKGLDVKLKKDLMNSFLKIWNKDKRTVLFITHDIDEALELSNSIYILNELPAKVVKKIEITSTDNLNNIKDEMLKLF